MENKIKILLKNYFKKNNLKLNETNIFCDLDSLQTVQLLNIIEKKLKKKINLMKIINKKKVNIKYLCNQ